MTQPILHVLDVLDQIRESEGKSPGADEVRNQVKQMLGQFDLRGPWADQFYLAKCAIVYWTDEVLTYSGWQHARSWENSLLERDLFGTRHRAWKFFEDAARARNMERLDAFEVFAICVANGFEGVYRDSEIDFETVRRRIIEEGEEAAVVTERANFHIGFTDAVNPDVQSRFRGVIRELPNSLDEWSQAVFLQFLEDRLQPFESSRPYDTPRGARPIATGQSLAKWSLLLTLMVMLTAGLLWLGG